MRVLLVYPEFPTTYWGFQHSMPLVGKRASLPPLGLISLAALLPDDWEQRLVDLNIEQLSDEQLRWADAVLIGGMRVQAASIHQVIARARALGRRTVVGGPAPTTSPSEYADADLIFRGEAEGRIDTLIDALGRPPGAVRMLAPPTDARPSLDRCPPPRFDLLRLEHYTAASVQVSRGCPFSCEFCDVIEIFGRKPRLKSPAQVLAELDALLALGWRGSLFVVDDNFIGNRVAVRALLAQLIGWQRARGYPFELFTEASVNLATDERLLSAMVDAGFSSVFVGIETPSVDALEGAGKRQNTCLDLSAAVERLTAAGLEVMGGFIVGFDQDHAGTFELQRRFIEQTAIPLAMVGLMMALPGTALWRRLEREGRLREVASGDQFNRPNFEPTLDERILLRGYAQLLQRLYQPAAYYGRCRAFVDRVGRVPGRKRVRAWHLGVLARAVVQIGLRSPWRREFWGLMVHALRRPHTIAAAVGLAVQGEHMIRYTQEDVLPRLARALTALSVPRPVLTSATSCASVDAARTAQQGAP